MTLRSLKWVVAVFCLGSIGAMIAASIADNNGAAVTAGMVGAIAMLCLITANAVTRGSNQGGAQDALAAELEARVGDLVAAGTDEVALRSIVRKAVRMGRGYSPGQTLGTDISRDGTDDVTEDRVTVDQ